MSREIVLYPAEILTTPAKEVVEITDEVIELLDEMYELMVSFDGVGLAAPQVGESLRIALVQLEPDSEVFELINPVIYLRTGTGIDVEGCLSFPDIYGTVERSERIVVRYCDREGTELELMAEDYLARVIQHEVDHLDGYLFTDKIIDTIAVEDLERYMEEQQ